MKDKRLRNSQITFKGTEVGRSPTRWFFFFQKYSMKTKFMFSEKQKKIEKTRNLIYSKIVITDY